MARCKHDWLLGQTEGVLVLVWCQRCRAVVVNEVSHTATGGHAFAFGVLRPGGGVSSADLRSLGAWFAGQVGEHVAAHIDMRPGRSKQKQKQKHRRVA